MASNPYVNFYTNTAEQTLVENLVVEALRFWGHDMYYLPRTGIRKDKILNEYQYSSFDTALPIEMYIKNFSGFEGDGQFLSKFNVEVRDQVTLTMSRRSFGQFIQPTTQEARPMEGDCIYIPMTENLFQISFVESNEIWYQMGTLQTWELKMELFEHAGEKFQTGIQAIDDQYNAYNDNIIDYSITDEEGADLLTHDGNNLIDSAGELGLNDTMARNKEFTEESDEILDFTEKNPFGSMF